MSTRSDIIVHCNDGHFRRVYCHWDGYPSHNGKILQESYNDRGKASHLVALGDISSLGSKGGKIVKWDANKLSSPKTYVRYKKYEDVTLYYAGRTDQIEDPEVVAPKVFDTYEEAWPEAGSWTEYTYVYANLDQKGFKWWIGDPDQPPRRVVELTRVLSGEIEIESYVKAFGGLILGKHGSGEAPVV